MVNSGGRTEERSTVVGYTPHSVVLENSLVQKHEAQEVVRSIVHEHHPEDVGYSTAFLGT